MKKSLVVCCALFLACSSAAVLTACNDDSGTQEAFATYETWQDGFDNINMMDGFGRITRSDEKVHGGKYSAKLQPLGSHTDPAKPYFYYPMQIEGGGGYNYTNYSCLESISFWMYNAETEKVTFELCIVASVADVYGTDCKAVQTVELEPGKWTKVTYEPDYNGLQDMCDITNVAGFAFRFENQNSDDIADAPVLYLDDMTVSMADQPLAQIKTSTPERGELQSFDLASSMVYVRMQSGLDYSESYLAAGSDKLQGIEEVSGRIAKGGIEFAITDSEMGSWPRLHFDSRTPESELQKADRFSLMIYVGMKADANVQQVELCMFPDTSSEYTEYVETNKWVKLTIDSETMINNWGDSVGVKSMGLFWIQNGSATTCFNAIQNIRIADIRAEFDEVRIPELSDGVKGTEYTIPAATLEVDEKQVTAESWSYAVSYKNAALCGDEEHAFCTMNGNKFTPNYGGTYIITYTATYQSKTYTASREIEVERAAAAEGEMESFDDPAALDTIAMNNGAGTVCTPEYLWAGDTRLPDGAKGGVRYEIADVVTADFSGSWPRFFFDSRIGEDAIGAYDLVTFDIYLEADGIADGTDIPITLYPETTKQMHLGYAVQPNTWVTVRLDKQTVIDVLPRLGMDGTGLFWVQNGGSFANKVNAIRIANIRACEYEDVREEPKANEIELFGDEYSMDNVLHSDAILSKRYDPDNDAVVFNLNTDDATFGDGYWPHFQIKPRQSLAHYQGQVQTEGYNAVTLEVYLKPVSEAVKQVNMCYWSGAQNAPSANAPVATGKWVTLTFDIDTFFSLLEAAEAGNGYVDLFWVASVQDAKLESISVRNIQLAKTDGVIAMKDGAEGFFYAATANATLGSTYYQADASAIPTGGSTSNGAVAITIAPTDDCWPNIKFGADKSFFEESDANIVEVTLYVANTNMSEVELRLHPDGPYCSKGYKLEANKWVTLELDAKPLYETAAWSADHGVNSTNLFWFSNALTDGNTTVWIAGIKAVQKDVTAVAFSESGISVTNNNPTMYEDWDHNTETFLGMRADIAVTNTSMYGYDLTITDPNDKQLTWDTDYRVSQEAVVTLLSPVAGKYTLNFVSPGGRFHDGTVEVTVAEKTFKVAANTEGDSLTAPDGSVNMEYTLPTAVLSGAEKQDKVTWTVTVTDPEEKTRTLGNGGKFTPTKAGNYSADYTATYLGKEYTQSVTFTVQNYAVTGISSLFAGTSGTDYDLNTVGAELTLGGTEIEVGVTWSYSVAFSDAELYETYFDELSVSDGKFKPMMAGTYMVTFTATYNGEPYSATAELTVERVAAGQNEIESFNDAASLGNVRLESGADYAETYLTPEKDSAKLPAGAQYGVSFTVTDSTGGNWPNLHFDAVRMTADAIKRYDYVIIPMYIGVKPNSGVTQVQIDVSGKRVIVKPDTWTNVMLDASYFADEGTESILWIQNGGDDVVNQVNEVRIAGVSVGNHSNTSPALLDMRSIGLFDFTDVWLGAEDALKIDGQLYGLPNDIGSAPDGLQYAMRFYFEGGNIGTFSMRTRVTDQTLNPAQKMLNEGYTALDISFYAVPQNENSVNAIQITTVSSNQNDRANLTLPVGEWVTLRFGLEGLKKAFFWNGNDAAWQIDLFYVDTQGAQLTELLATGFMASKPSRIDVVSFGDDGAVAAFNASDKLSAEWKDASALTEESIAAPDGMENGVVKLAPSETAWNVRITSKTVDKSLYKSYTAKMLVYLKTGSGGQVSLKAVHNGIVTLENIQTNAWVTIEVPAYQEGTDNDLYDVYDWFAGSTGWLQDSDSGVSAIYIAGVWLESSAT